MTIAVTFRDVEYTVTFKYTDADGAQEKTEKYKYGQNLKNPTFVNLPSGHLIFGWNFESKDGEAQQRDEILEFCCDRGCAYRLRDRRRDVDGGYARSYVDFAQT